jgi:hypothetical protein
MRRLTRALALVLGLLAIGSSMPAAALTGSHAESVRAGRRVLGYYVPYDPASWTTLEAQAHLIDIVAVQWVTIDGCGRLTSEDDQTVKRFAQAAGIAVYPSLLTNSGWLNERILTDDEAATRAIMQIVDYVLAEGYDGFDLDLEAVRPDDRDAYTAFVARPGRPHRPRPSRSTKCGSKRARVRRPACRSSTAIEPSAWRPGVWGTKMRRRGPFWNAGAATSRSRRSHQN